MDTFRTGCRYWSRRAGPFFFADGWDEGEIADELAHIGDVGFDFVCVALPWEAIQPTATLLRSPLLDRLEAFLERAQAAGLTVQLTLAGQVGGTLFLPRWLLATEPEAPRLTPQMRLISEGAALPWSLGNLYDEAALLNAQRHLWREVVRTFAPHPALTEVDLSAGDLLSAAPPRHPDEAFRWWEALREVAGNPVLTLLYTAGLAWLQPGSAPRLAAWRAAVGHVALATVPRTGAKPTEADSAWPCFLMRLAQTLAQAPVGCATLGLPTAPDGYPEEEQARFFSEVLPALHALGVPFICHAAWADAPPALNAAPPYDANTMLRHSGLLRADGSEKEAAALWRTFNRQHGHRLGADAPATLGLDPDEWYHPRAARPDALAQLYPRHHAGEV